MSPAEEQLRIVLGTSIAYLAIGIFTTSISLFAIAEHIRRGKSRSPLLLWFGLFAGLYGLRVLCRTAAIRMICDLPADFWHEGRDKVQQARQLSDLLLPPRAG